MQANAPGTIISTKGKHLMPSVRYTAVQIIGKLQ
jgi:hypothetical protein